MSKVLKFSEIKNAGLKECPVRYESKSGAVFEFDVKYRPEGLTPAVMIAFDELDVAYKEQEKARKEEREPTMKVDLAATSRILASLIGWMGLTDDNDAPIFPSEAFFLNASYEFHSSLITSIMEDYARPTSGSPTESGINSPVISTSAPDSEGSPPVTSLPAPPAISAEVSTVS